jgi:penicillin-binding protein 1A
MGASTFDRNSRFEESRYERLKLIMTVVLTCVTAVGMGAFSRFTSQLNERALEFRLDSGPQSTLVFDRHNELIFAFSAERRSDRELEGLGASVVPAVLAAEDKRFYRHPGIDPVRIAGAFVANVKAGRIVQGGSTITQQLVRLTLLDTQRQFVRKLRESLLALRIERRYAKHDILEAYLNRVYFGAGYYGIEAAAEGYFGKSASDVSDAEAATLAGLIKCPSTCSPRVSPERARARRNVVLTAMYGRGWLSEAAYSEARGSELRVVPKTRTSDDEIDRTGHMQGLFFKDAVRRQLVRQFGEDRVYRDGLRVYTTIDPPTQQAAEDAITGRLAELNKARTGTGAPRVEGSLVAIDPETGEVVALVGGSDFKRSPFNRALDARRQPGSAFKPILFAAALEQGFTPGTVVTDLDGPTTAGIAAWWPAGEHEASSYTLRCALTVSSNRAAARLIGFVGASQTVDYAKRLGIASTLPRVPSLALGTGEVTLLELTSAYGTFANGGMAIRPTLIRRVEDRSGAIIFEPQSQPLRVLRPSTAFLITHMLVDVINRGTGSQARALGFRLPAAGKTGTSDGYADAWFIGYTPHLVAGVWFGFDNPQTIMQKGFASTVAVPAWAQFMLHATNGQAPEGFPVPGEIERVVLCRESHLLATEYCRLAGGVAASESSRGDGTYEEVFASGTAPREPCPIHTEPNGEESSADGAAQPFVLQQ